MSRHFIIVIRLSENLWLSIWLSGKSLIQSPLPYSPLDSLNAVSASLKIHQLFINRRHELPQNSLGLPAHGFSHSEGSVGIVRERLFPQRHSSPFSTPNQSYPFEKSRMLYFGWRILTLYYIHSLFFKKVKILIIFLVAYIFEHIFPGS